MSSGANRLSQVWTEMIMGLPISIHLRSSSDPAALMVAVESAFARLREADLRFSPYRQDSELTKYVLGEFELEFASAAFRSVLNLAETARQFTDGAFDVRAGGTLDPSGLVKGWAAEQAAQTLPANHYLNAGGDITMHSTSMPWRIGIEHPEDPTGLLAVVSLGTGGIATSGSTHRGTHIIDPTTGDPARGIKQATVIGPSLMSADIWATALVARGLRILDLADELLSRMVNGGYQALLATDDGTLYATDGFCSFYAPDQPKPRATLLKVR
jgi:thiamine biosynthesis lipoprotein